MLRADMTFQKVLFLIGLVTSACVVRGVCQGPQQATISITAALVAQELQVRPVALHQLELLRAGQTTPSASLRTGLDGKVKQAVAAGDYRLRSVTAVQLLGKSYRWDVPVTLLKGKVSEVELTNVNAIVDTVVVTQTATRQVAPEIALYEHVRRGVVRVEAGLKRGSGFFIDTLGGLIVTNDHVIAGERTLSISLDTTKRVVAQLVARDHDGDLVLLRINPNACPDCPHLRIARPDSTGTTVVPGERVIAVGFPLHQLSTVTSGIVSSVREHAIISDVNINHGNSGGPLLNGAGEVVGVNTFADLSESGGPGISGSIPVGRLGPLLKHAADTLRSLPSIEYRVLPTVSGPPYPLVELRAAADSVPVDDYENVQGFKVGNFTIALSTPVANLVYAKKYEDEVAKDRRKREARAGLTEGERYSEIGTMRDWTDYVGDLTEAAVSVEIDPRQGETFWSGLGRALSASQGYVPGRAKYVFKGDLQDAQWYRNGTPVEPVVGGRTPQRVYVQDAWVEMKDVAYRGLYIFNPEVFAPDSTGAPPSIVVHIFDLKHPDDRNWVELGGDVVARVWNDFGPYYTRLRSDRPFRTADAERFKSNIDAFCAQMHCDTEQNGSPKPF
jgi:S1-C subfamily serine protease